MKLNRCTFCGYVANDETRVVQGYIILKSCEDCEDNILSTDESSSVDYIEPCELGDLLSDEEMEALKESEEFFRGYRRDEA